MANRFIASQQVSMLPSSLSGQLCNGSTVASGFTAIVHQADVNCIWRVLLEPKLGSVRVYNRQREKRKLPFMQIVYPHRNMLTTQFSDTQKCVEYTVLPTLKQAVSSHTIYIVNPLESPILCCSDSSLPLRSEKEIAKCGKFWPKRLFRQYNSNAQVALMLRRLYRMTKNVHNNTLMRIQ